jgi:Zn-dependent protease with chaperone function
MSASIVLPSLLSFLLSFGMLKAADDLLLFDSNSLPGLHFMYPTTWHVQSDPPLIRGDGNSITISLVPNVQPRFAYHDESEISIVIYGVVTAIPLKQQKQILSDMLIRPDTPPFSRSVTVSGRREELETILYKCGSSRCWGQRLHTLSPLIVIQSASTMAVDAVMKIVLASLVIPFDRFPPTPPEPSMIESVKEAVFSTVGLRLVKVAAVIVLILLLIPILPAVVRVPYSVFVGVVLYYGLYLSLSAALSLLPALAVWVIRHAIDWLTNSLYIDSGKITYTAIVLFIAQIVAIIVSLRLFVIILKSHFSLEKRTLEEPLLRIDKHMEAALWQSINELSGLRPTEYFNTIELNSGACVRIEVSMPYKKTLVMGMPLLLLCTRLELAAILGHEAGHLRAGQLSYYYLVSFLLRLGHKHRRLLEDTVDVYQHKFNSKSVIGSSLRPIRSQRHMLAVYARLTADVLRYVQKTIEKIVLNPVSQYFEYYCDHLAAKRCGVGEFANALLKVDIMAAAERISGPVAVGRSPSQVTEWFRQHWTSAQLAAREQFELNRDVQSSHPAIKERLRRIEALPSADLYLGIPFVATDMCWNEVTEYEGLA